MKIVKVKNKNSQQLPAEIRSYGDGKMVVLVKSFETAKLTAIEMLSEDGVSWASVDGEYSCQYDGENFTKAPDVLVRVPKK